ncbi:MAG: beta-galactosidase [Terracidiphilus sp.]
MNSSCVACFSLPRRIGRLLSIAFLVALSPVLLAAKTVVFWQPGFPTVDSEPVDHDALGKAFAGTGAVFADLKILNDPATLEGADLLVLPYGSVCPTDAWNAIRTYLHAGGNLLVIGGQPLHVPVTEADGKFVQATPQDTYARALQFNHTYAVPVSSPAHFAWKHGYAFGQTPAIRASRFFAVEGHLDGLGYMVDSTGLLAAAPVIVADYGWGPMQGSRVVALDFDPEPGYWESQDGIALMKQAALYASQGATELSVELQFSAIRPGETPQITVHLNSPHLEKTHAKLAGEVKVQVSSEDGTVDSISLPVADAAAANLPVPAKSDLAPGFYTVTATFSAGATFREFYQNGFWVEPATTVDSGPELGVHGNFLTEDGQPFLPVGTNYFTTEENGWEFSSARNAWVWEKDFAEMAAHGVSFVRTGVWFPNTSFVDKDGGVNQRFLRNLEAYLLCAQRHKIAVNFTFFAFTPKYDGSLRGKKPEPPVANPYLDPASLATENAYVRSVVDRFKNVPFLSYDLINEPSFSNPYHVFQGSYPNGDPAELAAWHKWLSRKYDGKLDALASAWRVTPDRLSSPDKLSNFDAVPLPRPQDLAAASGDNRYGNANEVRALDYNLFAQDIFSDWVREMVALIRGTGSKQLVDVGQDEGGVTDRVLNQFYGSAGVSFTTNHTYWQDDALLWDSIAAKRLGQSNITGETGYQPVWAPDGTWRYDELTGLGLIERKWALGFAAGSSGALQWDWAREADFGMQRSDGSAKVWEGQMQALGEFARQAAPLATGFELPQVALVLPQSLQLSVGNSFGIEAQQSAVRALYGYARSEAYAVGEYQIDQLGSPKLILLPSPFGLTQHAWQVILDHVKDGAVLLVTGPFDGDAHMHPTGRQNEVGLEYRTEPLSMRDQSMHFPGGDEKLIFSGSTTTYLSEAVLSGGDKWVEKSVGRGKILFAALPIELNDNLAAVGDVYRHALKVAGVAPVYSTTLSDPGIIVCPTQYPDATLYVITSESDQKIVDFTDVRSGKHLTGTLQNGEAAIVLIGKDGKLIASYNWNGE